MIAKKNVNGTYHIGRLTGLNQRAESLKKELQEKTSISIRKRNIVWLVIIILSVLSISFAPWLIIAFVIFGTILGRSTDYDGWLGEI